MDHILEKSLSELTEDEWHQIQQLKKKKPTIAFSKATIDDCMKPEGLALYTHNTTLNDATLHIPDDFAGPIASDFLCETLDKINKVWVLDNEKACRSIIDAILIEVLSNESSENLLGFCEVKNDWEGPGYVYVGNVDYMLGTSRTKSVASVNSLLLVKIAEKHWPNDDVARVICEAGCLLKRRQDEGKNTPVFAVLTNGTLFRFFAIDTDGTVYASVTSVLVNGKDRTYNSSTSLSEILRWFTWFTTSIKSGSPRENMTDDEIEASLTRLRSCFGLINPNSNKKLKVEKE